VIDIPPAEVGELLFGQQHLGTQRYFVERCGQYHTIPLAVFPHYQFLCHYLGRETAADNPYLQYLEQSWSFHYGPEKNTPELRAARAVRFAEQFAQLSASRQIEPIRVCRRPDGGLLVVDGNHRASIACRLGLGLKAELLPLEQHLQSISSVPDEFYGTKRLDKPYQSIIHRGRELVEGRRKDVAERMRHVAEADLAGKRVLDLGCNLGMSCYLAAERGAAEVAGIEGSRNIASAAIRLNSVFAAPCSFLQHDLGIELPLAKFDTIFCFSIINHVKNKEALVRTVDGALGSVVYFEGHAQTSMADYEYFLNARRFSKIDLLGYTSDGIHKSSSSRPLWRCEARRS
jgi:hypothetical protein